MHILRIRSEGRYSKVEGHVQKRKLVKGCAKVAILQGFKLMHALGLLTEKLKLLLSFHATRVDMVNDGIMEKIGDSHI